jgi:sugar phosphate isomerase/epimerase
LTGQPSFAISQISTLAASFEDDLSAYAAAGAEGIGVWEIKLPGDGADERAAEALAASGLRSCAAVPAVPSILPLQRMPGPIDPSERVAAICKSIERLRPFRPSAIVLLTGSGKGLDPDDARATVEDGVRTIAAAAREAGTEVALEPYQRIDGENWSIVTSLGDAAGLNAEVGLLADVWHLWNSETLDEDLERYGDRIAAVHVSDYREPTRGFADRVLPGDGVADVPRVLAAIDRAGWTGPYELEIFSDNGTFGSDYDDSLWKLPADELARRGRDAFFAAWEARK